MRFVVGRALQVLVVLSRAKPNPNVLKLPDEHNAVTPLATQATGTVVPTTAPGAITFPSRSRMLASGSPPVQSASGFAQMSIPPIVSRPEPPALNDTLATLDGAKMFVRLIAANACNEPTLGSTPATAAVFCPAEPPVEEHDWTPEVDPAIVVILISSAPALSGGGGTMRTSYTVPSDAR